jgi:hypothetical protein
MQIINPWMPDKSGNPKFYTVGPNEEVYRIGDYAIYHHRPLAWLYVYKDFAFSELAGLNKEHLKNVANRTPPDKNAKPSAIFLYNRSIETLSLYKK